MTRVWFQYLRGDISKAAHSTTLDPNYTRPRADPQGFCLDRSYHALYFWLKIDRPQKIINELLPDLYYVSREKWMEHCISRRGLAVSNG